MLHFLPWALSPVQIKLGKPYPLIYFKSVVIALLSFSFPCSIITVENEKHFFFFFYSLEAPLYVLYIFAVFSHLWALWPALYPWFSQWGSSCVVCIVWPDLLPPSAPPQPRCGSPPWRLPRSPGLYSHSPCTAKSHKAKKSFDLRKEYIVKTNDLTSSTQTSVFHSESS